MDRRGFLGSLMAVTSAIASGVKLPAHRELPKASPAAVKVQDDLLRLLDECVPLSVKASADYDQPMTYEVEYLHAPDAKRGDIALMLESYTRQMKPVRVSFHQGPMSPPQITVVWA